MEKKTIFEKLGLVEKVINGNEFAINKMESGIVAEIENTNLGNYINKVDVKEEVNYTEDPVALVKRKKLLKVEEIYKNYDIDSQGINSLSIVESFQRALPDYLPADVKRQSILNIIASSSVKVENLVSDGNEKLKCLKDFSQLSANESNEIILKFENDIKKLDEKISSFNKAIEDMKKLQSEQDFSVKYEIGKINTILQFIGYEK